MTSASPRIVPATPLESNPALPRTQILGWTFTILFITAAIVLNAVVLTWVNVAGGQWPQPATIVGLALIFAQQGIVALACGFGRQHFLFRVLLFLVSGCLAGMVGAICVGRQQIQGSWILMLLANGLVVLAAVWVARACGWRLTGANDSAVASSPWQFSLARLFALMTSAAIILGIGQRLRVEQGLVGDILFLAFLFAVTPLIIGSLVLARRNWGTVILGSAAAVWGVGGTLSLTTLPSADRGFLGWFWVAMLNALLILATLSILRLAGYALVRVSK